MKSTSKVNDITANTLSTLGMVLGQCNQPDSAISCLSKAMDINPKCLKAHLQMGNIFLKMKKYEEAASIYKRAIGLQPTLSTVYNLGASLSKGGSLNDRFYQAVLKVIEIPEVVSMIECLAESPILYQPSKLWLYFMIFNTFQLETGGIDNFKRTVNHNYFNWTADEDVNKQFQALKQELKWTDDDLVSAGKLTHYDDSVKPKEFTEEKWKTYVQFLCMLWEFTSNRDRLNLLKKIQEPQLGNPVYIEYKNYKVSQDICNSVMEVNTMAEVINFKPTERFRIIELGAGHGRVENVLLQALNNVQTTIIDIPPALYVSQWYLSNLFPERKIFKFRKFSNYSEIRQEFEEADIAFLSPAQIELLPDQIFDLFINISSLHEMTHAQIEMWFGHIDRVCKKWFYTKQYVESKNGFDDIVIHRDDYPVRPHWQEFLNRRSLIYPDLFEAIYRIH